MKATWNGQLIAESTKTEVVDGNHYFPPESVKMDFFTPTETKSTCPYKGDASYFSITVGDDTNADAAWVYKEPKEGFAHIKDYIAFWKGVAVEE